MFRIDEELIDSGIHVSEAAGHFLLVVKRTHSFHKIWISIDKKLKITFQEYSSRNHSDYENLDLEDGYYGSCEHANFGSSSTVGNIGQR